ncbi:MAG: Ralstonia phage, partial [Pseudomonadota bacterium]
MPLFKLYLEKDDGQTRSIAYYDSTASTLKWEDGAPVIKSLASESSEVGKPAKIQSGKGEIKVLKIQLGLNCNFECTYCNQRYVPRTEASAQESLDEFLRTLPTWFTGGKNGLGSGVRIEFWGGEPFVYWKTLKPLAERIKQDYPSIKFSVITNGSLLDLEKNDWLVKMGFTVSISHDGPAQHVRGPD